MRPTARQHVALTACVTAHRELYNAALQERRDSWSHNKTRIYYGDQSAQLTEIRSIRPDQAVWSFSSRQATLERYDLLVVEELAIANMVRRAKPVPDPDAPGSYLPNGGRAKSGLNRSISDASWGGFLGILRAKAEGAGRAWIEVDPRHTSDGCENCGYAARENRVTQAEFVCQRCSHRAQADEHAARNVLRAGLALHADAA
jgi:putative transposase